MLLTRVSIVILSTFYLIVDGRIYKRCELARELRNFDIPEEELPKWVCIAKHESNFDTAAMNPGSGDHGLFQISEIYWCLPSGYGCNSPCSKFRDDDIADDLQCIRRIHNEHTRISGDGFNAWVVYPLYCKGITYEYVQDCFDEETQFNSTSSIIDNEISTEDSDEDGDGYNFPPLPGLGKKEDEYEFPKLPFREQKALKPYSKTSAIKKTYYDLPKFPSSKFSIHHSITVEQHLRSTISNDLKTNPFLTGKISSFMLKNEFNLPRIPASKGSIHDSNLLTKAVTNNIKTNPFLNGKFAVQNEKFLSSKYSICDSMLTTSIPKSIKLNPFLNANHDGKESEEPKDNKLTKNNEIRTYSSISESIAQNPFLYPKSSESLSSKQTFHHNATKQGKSIKDNEIPKSTSKNQISRIDTTNTTIKSTSRYFGSTKVSHNSTTKISDPTTSKPQTLTTTRFLPKMEAFIKVSPYSTNHKTSKFETSTKKSTVSKLFGSQSTSKPQFSFNKSQPTSFPPKIEVPTKVLVPISRTTSKPQNSTTTKSSTTPVVKIEVSNKFPSISTPKLETSTKKTVSTRSYLSSKATKNIVTPYSRSLSTTTSKLSPYTTSKPQILNKKLFIKDAKSLDGSTTISATFTTTPKPYYSSRASSITSIATKFSALHLTTAKPQISSKFRSRTTSATTKSKSTTEFPDLEGASSTYVPYVIASSRSTTTLKPLTTLEASYRNSKKFISTTTSKPTGRQVTFAPDSFFSWLFNSQTLPPIVAPPRPGTRTTTKRPNVDERPPLLPGALPLRPEELGIVTTRRPLPRPSRPQQMPIQSDVNISTSRRPLPRPSRPQQKPVFLSGGSLFEVSTRKSQAVLPHRRRPMHFKSSQNATSSEGKNFDEKPLEVKVDDHVVYFRSKYGFKLFRS